MHTLLMEVVVGKQTWENILDIWRGNESGEPGTEIRPDIFFRTCHLSFDVRATFYDVDDVFKVVTGEQIAPTPAQKCLELGCKDAGAVTRWMAVPLGRSRRRAVAAANGYHRFAKPRTRSSVGIKSTFTVRRFQRHMGASGVRSRVKPRRLNCFSSA